MTQVRHISTTTVRPTGHNDELTHRIELTPFDLRLIQLDYIQKGLLFHREAEAETEHSNSLVEHLKASLSRTLNIFYLLAGRLAVTENEDNTTCFFINCNGDGAQFVHAAADGIAVVDILKPIYVPHDIVHNLFPMNGVLNYEGVSKPLLAVQVNELVDGIFISCSINHVVADGTTFWHFFNTWSEISRIGSHHKISQTPPTICHQFLDGLIGLPVHMPFSHCEIMGRLIRPSSSIDYLQSRVFHFSKEKVAELKAKANSEMGTNNMISSLQALLAHLWRATTRNRHLIHDQEVTYVVAVGLRQRLKPPLPKEHMGNAIKGVAVKSTAGELLKHGLGWAALQINKTIASLTAEEARKSLEDWGNDFGWGRPLAVRSGAGNIMNGKLTVFPGAEEGSVDFEVCLLRETLQAMADDAEYMEAVLT